MKSAWLERIILVSFDYSKTSEEISMQLGKDGRHRKTLKTGSTSADVTEIVQVRKSACKMMRTLVILMRTLNSVPEERTILMKLYYHDNTPNDYEPPFFRCCTYDEKKIWQRAPFRIKAGEVNSCYITFSLKVRSVLDPCEGEVEAISAGGGSSGGSEAALSDSADSEGNYRIEKIGSKEETADCTSKPDTCNLLDDDDMTQDFGEETRNLESFKEWLLSRPLTTFHFADVLSSFPDISEGLTEDLLCRLVKEGFLTNLGKDNYRINKGELNGQLEPEKQPTVNATETDESEDDDAALYTKALFYALPMDHVTVPRLQTKLGSNVTQSITRKLVERMVIDGFVEASVTNKKLGRKVIHSDKTKRKLEEVHEVLNQIQLSQKMTQAIKDLRIQPAVATAEDMDGSTFGALHSLGSDLTRHENSPLRPTNQVQCVKLDCDKPGSPASNKIHMSKRALSRESHLNEEGCMSTPALKQNNGRAKRGLEIQDSQQSSEKYPYRKASLVEEPIYQLAEKRLRQ